MGLPPLCVSNACESNHANDQSANLGPAAAEIKANYRRFMKLYHPDRGWPAPHAGEAYRTLSDRRLREAYDKKLRHHRTAFGSMMWGGGGLVRGGWWWWL
eukprot:jgi/Mesvir1/11317/Mv08173-RA.1